ncbi:anti-sigma factor antagonist [Streptomyces tauricus]|uniref:Anti-sigma factor antagonist n=1 Tax=Streptomyces tauricus TaxID=68274 RepID=A0ABZ1JEL6_9ACTN|nr:STAS domain-containing protein [Streptomyces tauricus]MCW8095294.1 STAS domain-containing protein [Streptomyces tauricus]GHA15427.1 anti-sigma factor antagonist [Streptomyces tauricus]
MDRGTVGSAQSGRLLVEVREEGTSAVVTPAGELDHHTADLLREPVEDCLDRGFVRLVVDCSRLEFCDSTGLNVLLGARLRAEAAGGGVHLAGMLPVVARVFEITGAEAVFTVHDTLEAALDDKSGAGDSTADGSAAAGPEGGAAEGRASAADRGE